ncbi:hypothetical protein SNEBB_001590 [Seison nebaliae]|nr:hypothetical protein SNEBB_001590 [Seison nebaliae]
MLRVKFSRKRNLLFQYLHQRLRYWYFCVPFIILLSIVLIFRLLLLSEKIVEKSLGSSTEDDKLKKTIVKNLQSSRRDFDSVWRNKLKEGCFRPEKLNNFLGENNTDLLLGDLNYPVQLEPFSLPMIIIPPLKEKKKMKIFGIPKNGKKKKYLLIIIHTGRDAIHVQRRETIRKLFSTKQEFDKYLVHVVFVLGMKDARELRYLNEFAKVNDHLIELKYLDKKHGHIFGSLTNLLRINHLSVISKSEIFNEMKISHQIVNYLLFNMIDDHEAAKHISWMKWFHSSFTRFSFKSITACQTIDHLEHYNNCKDLLGSFHLDVNKWNFKYIMPDLIMKLTDDIIPNISKLLESFEENEQELITTGDISCLKLMENEKSSSENCQEYPYEYNPPYCTASGYLIQPTFIRKIVILSDYIKTLKDDNILITGLLRDELWNQVIKVPRGKMLTDINNGRLNSSSCSMVSTEPSFVTMRQECNGTYYLQSFFPLGPIHFNFLLKLYNYN